MLKDCIILDTEKGKTYVVSFDDCDDIEEILTDNYELNLDNLQFMVVDKFSFERL